MQALSCRLEDLLPHRPPMVLIDEIVSFDRGTETLVAAFEARRDWSESFAAIEFMAQTAAALVGIVDREQGLSVAAKPGFLLGSRRMELRFDHFEIGKRYLVRATCLFNDVQTASFECAIEDDGQIIASATISAYRPDDIESFMEEQRL